MNYFYAFAVAALLYNFHDVQASFDEDQTQQRLREHFQKNRDAQKKIQDLRTDTLVEAADQLIKGISRHNLRVVRDRLKRGLLRNDANQPILTVVDEIQNNHQRKCKYFCISWVWQSTLDRESQALRDVIDSVLKKENPLIYAQLQQIGVNSMLQSGPVVTSAVVVGSPLHEQLLQK